MRATLSDKFWRGASLLVRLDIAASLAIAAALPIWTVSYGIWH